jgi:hypothetical protein
MIRILLVLIIAIFTFNPICNAEVKDIISEYTYEMGSGESRTDAEKKALEEAKRLAVEEAGTYIESYSEVVNNELTKDNIRTLAAGIMKTTVLQTTPIVENNTFKLYIKIKAVVDTSNLKEKMDELKLTKQKEKEDNDEEDEEPPRYEHRPPHREPPPDGKGHRDDIVIDILKAIIRR